MRVPCKRFQGNAFEQTSGYRSTSTPWEGRRLSQAVAALAWLQNAYKNIRNDHRPWLDNVFSCTREIMGVGIAKQRSSISRGRSSTTSPVSDQPEEKAADHPPWSKGKTDAPRAAMMGTEMLRNFDDKCVLHQGGKRGGP